MSTLESEQSLSCQVLSEPLAAGTALRATQADVDFGNRREHFRSPIEVTRPIGLALASPQGEPISPWISADILDLSTGGLCLVLMAGQDFEPNAHLVLNLRSQPGFGIEQLPVGLRWFVKGGLLVSLGVGFDQPFERLPSLA
ncbi:PilZ domain-containing protein [Cyanobium sp. Morenito 9A2]|uniref:PilZ domain-containing protein n=1 Tax=Cyanobium sp. Morenito 9A2 TaxID=2823718 RepID=UPI0020CCD74C|nr:PilZ domain-containing protein [Cyanobium sp. Morenito 9A2]MCP9850976.1 PilZ domain-containing protein [Cyanobium sp. Morenito 9A2]